MRNAASMADPLDPISEVAADDPHPVYRELREHHPVYHVAERDLWVISRYEDIQRAILDPETWTSTEGIVPSGYQPANPILITSDPPLHTVMRHSVDLLAQDPVVRGAGQELLEADPQLHAGQAGAQAEVGLPSDTNRGFARLPVEL